MKLKYGIVSLAIGLILLFIVQICEVFKQIMNRVFINFEGSDPNLLFTSLSIIPCVFVFFGLSLLIDYYYNEVYLKSKWAG